MVLSRHGLKLAKLHRHAAQRYRFAPRYSFIIVLDGGL
jgi:hypothetical protein